MGVKVHDSFYVYDCWKLQTFPRIKSYLTLQYFDLFIHTDIMNYVQE